MAEICNDATSTPDPVNQKRWKRGEFNPETGLCYWNTPKATGKPYWITPETCKRYKEKGNETTKTWLKKNAEHVKERRRLKYEADREVVAARRKTRYERNKEQLKGVFKAYREANREKVNASIKRWHQMNKDRVRVYRKKRMATNVLFNMSERLRNRLNISIRRGGYSKKSSTQEILGCSWAEFCAHIEGLFSEGMNWDNRGLWHLDHRIPLVAAKTEEELFKLAHYTNIQPLWAADNQTKKAKMPHEMVKKG